MYIPRKNRPVESMTNDELFNERQEITKQMYDIDVRAQQGCTYEDDRFIYFECLDRLFKIINEITSRVNAKTWLKLGFDD